MEGEKLIKLSKQVVTMTREVGIDPKFFIMYGLPGDEKRTLQQTLRFIEDLDVDSVYFNPPIAYPGTELWQMTPEKDRCYNWPEYLNVEYDTADTAVPPKVIFNNGSLGAKELEWMIERYTIQEIKRKGR